MNRLLNPLVMMLSAMMVVGAVLAWAVLTR